MQKGSRINGAPPPIAKERERQAKLAISTLCGWTSGQAHERVGTEQASTRSRETDIDRREYCKHEMSGSAWKWSLECCWPLMTIGARGRIQRANAGAERGSLIRRGRTSLGSAEVVKPRDSQRINLATQVEVGDNEGPCSREPPPRGRWASQMRHMEGEHVTGSGLGH